MIKSSTQVRAKDVRQTMYLIYKNRKSLDTCVYILGDFKACPRELEGMSLQTMFERCGLNYDDAVADMKSGCRDLWVVDPECFDLVDYVDLKCMQGWFNIMVELTFGETEE